MNVTLFLHTEHVDVEIIVDRQLLWRYVDVVENFLCKGDERGSCLMMFTEEMLFWNYHTWLHLRKKRQVLNSNMLLVCTSYMNDPTNRDRAHYFDLVDDETGRKKIYTLNEENYLYLLG